MYLSSEIFAEDESLLLRMNLRFYPQRERKRKRKRKRERKKEKERKKVRKKKKYISEDQSSSEKFSEDPSQ